MHIQLDDEQIKLIQSHMSARADIDGDDSPAARLLKHIEEHIAEQNSDSAQRYRAAAQTAKNDEGELEIDDEALVSMGDDDGAYVQAWVWVTDAEAGLDPQSRLEYLRGELQAERISQGELLELQGLAEYIEDGDVELLEPAGVPEGLTGPEWVMLTALRDSEGGIAPHMAADKLDELKSLTEKGFATFSEEDGVYLAEPDHADA